MTAAAVAAPDAAPVLSVRDLCVEFDTRDGVRPVVQHVSLDVHAGRTLALLGESGSGKSVTAQTIMGLIDPPGRVTGGEVVFEGRDILHATPQERRAISGEGIAIVFQDALSALNPVLTVGGQIAELLRTRRGMGRRASWARAVELMSHVRIPAAAQRARDYPHQFSGGMRQRAMIAMALALEPRVLIADEPTTALDVTVQAQIMDLLLELQQESGMGLVLITHDLGVVAETADTLAVMYAGRIVEHGRVDEVFARPAHPYTRGLLRSIPRVDREEDALWAIPGSPPTVLSHVQGCAFAARCDVALEVCRVQRPELAAPVQQPRVRAAACHRRQEVFHGQV